MRTEVFLVGAFSSVAATGETGAFLAGSGLAFTSALGSSLTAADLASTLASALGAAALVVVFLAVVVVRLRDGCLGLGLG